MGLNHSNKVSPEKCKTVSIGILSDYESKSHDKVHAKKFQNGCPISKLFEFDNRTAEDPQLDMEHIRHGVCVCSNAYACIYCSV